MCAETPAVSPCTSSEITTITKTRLKKTGVIGPGLTTGKIARKIGTDPRMPIQPI
jgi:hypothetical protein